MHIGHKLVVAKHLAHRCVGFLTTLSVVSNNIHLRTCLSIIGQSFGKPYRHIQISSSALIIASPLCTGIKRIYSTDLVETFVFGKLQAKAQKTKEL